MNGTIDATALLHGALLGLIATALGWAKNAGSAQDLLKNFQWRGLILKLPLGAIVGAIAAWKGIPLGDATTWAAGVGIVTVVDGIIKAVIRRFAPDWLVLDDPPAVNPLQSRPPIAPLVVLLLAALPFMGGCIFSFKAPVPVQQARAQRSEAMSRYVVNSNGLIDFAVRMYQQSEYARVESLYMQDILAAKALPDASAAVTKMIDLDAKRDAAKAKVDAQVAKFRAIATKAQTDPVIAMKLDEAIAQYEAAGIDASAIPGTVDGILAILKNFGGK